MSVKRTYAHSEWALAPLIVTSVGNSEKSRAVVLTLSIADGDLRMDTEIVRLQHDLSSKPSAVRFTPHSYIVDNKTLEALAHREFDETVAAASETPYGGVVAANRAVQNELEQLASFCDETAAHWQQQAHKR